VVRSAVRFLHHINEEEEALMLLRKNPRTQIDPWLMAAEIAASDLAEKSSRFARIGEAFLEKADIHRYHTSELASALATLEMKAGKHRHSNKLFYESLRVPTQNALAQAVWASKRAGLDAINPELLVKAQASEAITLDLFNRGVWQDVITGAAKWSKEEGFSPRPHILASSVSASLLDRPDQAESIATKGLETNPRNPILLNNKAFAQILQGKITEANKTLSEVDLENTHLRDKICLLATTGLAFFRSGKSEEGRQCYQKAINLANAPEDVGLKTLASLYLAREEVLQGNKEGFKDFKRAYQTAEKLKQTNIPAIAERLVFDIGKEAARQSVPFEMPKETKPVFIEGDFFGPKSKAIVRRR
jgi:tetratricopeptide (TPR) repeat protein